MKKFGFIVLFLLMAAVAYAQQFTWELPPIVWLPEPLTFNMILTGIIIFFGVFLFFKEYFTIDTTAIIIMALFIIAGILSPQEGFSGFNNSATITVGCMFVLSAAIFKTGALNGFTKLLARAGRKHYLIALMLILVFTGLLSAFINDTAVVAMLLPVVLKLSKDTNTPASKLLMPLSFGALLGGCCTLIGTSTNILVSSIAESYGYEPFTMFEFSGAALWLMGAGIIYLMVAGIFFLPERKASKAEVLRENIDEYITAIQFGPKSKAIGKALGDSELVKIHKADVLQLVRNGEILSANLNVIINSEDTYRIVISPDKLKNLIDADDIHLVSNDNLKKELENENEKLFEILIPQGSQLAGRRVKNLIYGLGFHFSVLAIRRRDGILKRRFVDAKLQVGDLLLVMSNQDSLEELQNEGKLIIVSDYKQSSKPKVSKIAIAILVAAGVVATAAMGLAPIVITAMVGCVLLIIFRIINPTEAYQSIDWKVIFMLAGVLSMGTALQKTGGAEVLGSSIESLIGTFDPRIALSFVFFVTFMLTNFISNNATAALMAPIAINLAMAMQLSERPFIVAVTLAASLSFMTPMSYQTNTMIYAPGNYRFSDYLKVGTPLNIIIWIIATIVIPLYFPF